MTRYKIHYALFDQAHDAGNGFYWTWFDKSYLSPELLKRFYNESAKNFLPKEPNQLKPDEVHGGVVTFDKYKVAYRFYNGDKDKQNRPERFVLLTAWLEKIASDSSEPDCSQILHLPVFRKLTGIEFARQIPIPAPSWELTEMFPSEADVLQQQLEKAKQEKKLLELQFSAEKGDAASQNELGVYSLKKGDKQEAFEWFKKSAEQGNADAQNNLGVCYKDGSGTQKDVYESLIWFIRAAKQGNAKGKYNFGVRLQFDFKPFDLFMKSAEQGNTAAQYKLGECYETGELVVRDIEEAKKWYHKAADNGDAEAGKAVERLEKQQTEEKH